MTYFILMAFYGLLALVLESTWLAGLPVETIRFDFVLVAVAALSFYQEPLRAVSLIIFFGIMSDIVSGVPFAVSTISYLVIYGGIRLLISKISFQGGMALVFWMGIISIEDKLVSMLLLMALTGTADYPSVMITSMPAQAVLDAALALVMIPFLRWYWELSWEKITKPKGLVLK